MIIGRMWDTFRMACTASPFFSSPQAVAVTIFTAPLFEAATVALLGQVLNAPHIGHIAMRACLLSTSLICASFIALAIAYDKEIGVTQDIFSRRVLDIPYIMGLCCGGALIAVVSSALSFMVLGWLYAIDLAALGYSLSLIPLALIFGCAIGFISAMAIFFARDHYVILNFLTPVVPLLLGVLVPVSEYPGFLSALVSYMPLSASFEQIGEGAARYIPYDVVIVSVLFLVAIGLFAYCGWRSRKNGRL